MAPKVIKNIETQPGRTQQKQQFATPKIKLKYNDISDEEFSHIMNHGHHPTTTVRIYIQGVFSESGQMSM